MISFKSLFLLGWVVAIKHRLMVSISIKKCRKIYFFIYRYESLFKQIALNEVLQIFEF